MRELLSELIADIYEASYQPAYWPVVIKKLVNLSNSQSGALFILDKSIQEANSFHSCGLTARTMEDYQRYSHLDPAFLIMQDMPIGVAVNIHGAQQHALESAEYYENVRKKHDIGFVCGANVLVNEKQVVGLGLHRSTASVVYENEVLDVITELVPHLQRALRIHREFIRLRVEKSAMTAGFDNLMMGLVLLDHLGAPAYINPVAESILENHPAIKKVNDRITPTQHEDAVQLRRKIASCLEPGLKGDAEPGGVIGLHDVDKTHPLIVMVKPVATSELNNMIDGELVYAALYLSDPERPLPIAAEKIAGVYGLTHAEAQIAVALVNGLCLEEIAATQNKSIHTVRTHLKSTFQKTKTSKQSDLLRLLLLGVMI